MEAAAVPTNLSVETETRDGVTVLAVAGEVDLSTAPCLGQVVEQTLSPGAPLIVDLAGVEFIDSAGSRALALAERAATGCGARLLIIPSAAVSHVFQIAGLDAVFDLYDEPAEALAAARVTGVG
jgi:anti-sigma B factor antagonist